MSGISGSMGGPIIAAAKPKILTPAGSNCRAIKAGGAAQGFRAPNLSDFTRFDIARSGEQETPSLSLRPEKYLSLETGIKCLEETWQGSLSYFYVFIDGMITRVPTGNMIGGNAEVTRRNVGIGYIHGFEAAGYFDFSRIGLPQWQGAMALSCVHGETDTFPTSAAVMERRPMSRIQPPGANLSLRWEHPSRRCWAEGLIVAAAAQHRLSPDDERDTQRIPPGGTPAGFRKRSFAGSKVLAWLEQTGKLMIFEMFLPQPVDDVRRDPVNPPGPSLAGAHEEDVFPVRRDPGASVQAAGVDLVSERNPVRP